MTPVPLGVLVTGAGLVGCHAAAELLAAGHEVTLLDLQPDAPYVDEVAGPVELVRGDVGDIDALRQLLRARRVAAVVHTAGIVGPKAERNPYLAFVVNAHGTAAVLEACRLEGVRRVVHASSLAVYDWGAAAGLDRVGEQVPSGPATVYGASKVAAEAVVRGYAHRGFVDPVILRFAGVYGRGHYRGGSLLGAIVERALEQCLAGTPAKLPAALQPSEFLYARDAAQAVRLAVEREASGVLVCNIGSGEVTAPAELAATLSRVVPGARVAARASADTALPLDVRLARSSLGYRPRYPLEDGLADFAVRLTAAAQGTGPSGAGVGDGAGAARG